MSKRNKISQRQEAIRELINTHPIEDQDTLVELLEKEFDIETNQSIVSRDLRQLGASKILVNGRMIYELHKIDIQREILRLAILNIDYNDSTVVIKTFPALAAFVGDYLDMQEDLPMLGNIAGENTIFVTPAKGIAVESLFKDLCLALHYQKK